jgi:hypothetical protein
MGLVSWKTVEQGQFLSCEEEFLSQRPDISPYECRVFHLVIHC